MDKDLWLTDEDIHAFDEPTSEELEIGKLKKKIIEIDDKLEIAEYALNEIEKIINKAIADNLHKTRTIKVVAMVKKYREELLILRSIEKELIDYKNRVGKNG